MATEDLARYARFVELLTSSQQPLYAYISTLLAGDANAQDVLQETNIELWRKADQYDVEKPFLPWAYRFAYFRVLTFRKTQGASKLVFSNELLDLVDEAYRAVSEEVDERLSALHACLQGLHPSQRELVRYRYEEERSSAEIAARFQVSEQSIGGRLYRLRRVLSECIEFRVRQSTL